MAFQISITFLMILFSALIFQVSTASNQTYLDSRCSNNMMFTPNSTYQSDVDSVFLSLVSKAATNISSSSTSNAVYGLYLCRGDLTTASCKECVVAATVGLSGSYCPLKTAGVIWYAECMVRYSNDSFFGKMVELPRVIIWDSRNITGNKTRFSEVLGNTMNDLVVQAGQAGRSSVSNEAFFRKAEMITMFLTLRVFGQCTPDLIGKDCGNCLKIAFSQLRVGITGSVLQPSCNVWYDIYESTNSSNLQIRDKSGSKQLWIIATMVPAASVSIAVLLLCAILKKSRKSVVKDVDEYLRDIELLQYDLLTLQQATNNFSVDNKLGQGGFGSVYKGILSDGTAVAVKRTHMHKDEIKSWPLQFRNEILSVAKLQHRNLVRVLGFCLGENEMFLVFEYLPFNLTRVLFDPRRNEPLDWETRFKIIMGIAKGILYLHQDSRLRIVHRDLKPNKILLDEHMNPKIAGFGLATVFVDDEEDLEDGIAGTLGYICPHYQLTGRLSVKSDVYSFGVLILGIICGVEFTSLKELCREENPITIGYARETWRDGRVLEFVDEAIRDSCDINQVERCLHLGLLCVEEIYRRPTMATVVLMLECHSVTLPMPEQPAYMLSPDEPDQSPSAPMLRTLNDASITEIGPR